MASRRPKEKDVFRGNDDRRSRSEPNCGGFHGNRNSLRGGHRSLRCDDWWAAELRLDYAEDGSAYDATLGLRSTGLVQLVKRVRFQGAARGVWRGNRPYPSQYSEEINTGHRSSAAQLRFVSLVPQVMFYRSDTPAEAPVLDPADQAGTVDPASAIYAGLRLVSADDLCGIELQVFDGRRRGRVALGNAQAAGDQMTCTGEYQRLAGFSTKAMAERSRFPFTVIYSAVDDSRWQISEIRFQSLFGPGRLIRRAP